MKNEKEKQPERFGVGRGKFLVEITGPNICLVSIRKRNGEVEWQEYLPIEFATEFAKVEALEKKADSLRKGRDRWENKTLELRNEVEALTETLSKLNKVHDELNEDHTHQLSRGTDLEEKAENLQILLTASKEAQEYVKEEYRSLADSVKYIRDRNEELTGQLQTSERNRKNLEEKCTDIEIKYESLLETVRIEKKDSKAYFWLSLITILCLLGFALLK